MPGSVAPPAWPHPSRRWQEGGRVGDVGGVFVGGVVVGGDVVVACGVVVGDVDVGEAVATAFDSGGDGGGDDCDSGASGEWLVVM